MTESNSYIFSDIEDYYRVNGEFFVQFTIGVVNDKGWIVSDVAKVTLNSYRKFYTSQFNSYVKVTS